VVAGGGETRPQIIIAISTKELTIINVCTAKYVINFTEELLLSLSRVSLNFSLFHFHVEV
jgi:hypothetical protein